MLFNEYDLKIINAAVERFGANLTVDEEALNDFVEATNSASVNKRRRLVHLADSLRSKLSWSQFYFIFRAALAEQPNDATYSTLLVSVLNWFLIDKSYSIEDRKRAGDDGFIIANQALANSPNECSFMFLHGLLNYRYPESENNKTHIFKRASDWFQRSEDCYKRSHENIPQYVKMYQGHCLVALSDYSTAFSIYQSIDRESLKDSTTEAEFAEFENNFLLTSERCNGSKESDA